MINVDISKTLNTTEGIIKLKAKFEVKKSEIVTIYGKSGAGKTTILRILAGLSNSEDGYIKVNNETWFNKSKNINISPQKRKIGFVFQDYALFPNMTVRKNIEYAAKSKKKVDELIDLVNLKQLEKRKPATLSGGQKQRVALARALAFDPELLLLDEPLSALDIEMRQEMQDEIIKINRHYNITIVLVSHDLAEIFKLSDKVIVLDKGEILKQGKPIDIFADNKLSAKFQFIGEILNIEKSDVVTIVNVLIGNNIIKVIATKSESDKLSIGEKIIVASKAFNPVILKLPEGGNKKRIKNKWFTE